MGIRGLTTYVDTLPHGEGKVWESFDLHDTNIVIDGCGLFYHMYTFNRLNFKYGGQYDQLQKKLEEFFTKLRLNNVVPYVVIDGIMARDGKKFDTSIRRKTERIERMKNLWTSNGPHHYKIVLPRLVRLTVVQMLQKMKVPYAVADFEADCEIASLANELDAPVMANDSDFYIFNIKRGYIPFQQLDNFSSTSTTVKKFSYDGFTKHLRIHSSMLPLLASLIGNDYISGEMLRPFTVHIEELDGGSKVPTIAQFLSKHDSVSEAIHAVIGLYSNEHKSAFEKALHLSIDEYQMKQSNLIGYFRSDDLSCSVRTYNGHSLPQWLIKLYREGLIASGGLSCLCNRKIFLPTQCEDVSLPSAQICARDLRWYYYALALNCEHTLNCDTTNEIIVTELYRGGPTLVPRMVNLTRQAPDIKIQIHDIPKMSDQAKRNHLLSMLHSDLPFIHGLPIEHQLVASALRYWVTHAQVKPAHLAALLVHYVGEKQSSSTSKSFHISLEAVHGFSQWQNVLYWVERFNALFCYTFEQLQVTKLYDGVHVCFVYERQLEDTEFAESIVTNANVYRQLYDVVTKDLPSDCQFNQS